MSQNVIKIVLNSDIYNLEAILNACYAFIDRAYVFLDSDSKGKKVRVSLESKQVISAGKKAQLRGDFENELLYCSLRHKIGTNNKKIREYIVNRAIYSALPISSEDFNSDALKDPLGIAIPWEEKYGNVKKNNAKSKV
ncbi:MAG: His-Xaa-Ser system protein HxsD [Candidatus Omnitrophica bacterium]|nr:His-Xaa-Ser system protein HxsD [Candidatus Omnitrophota bacterium]MDD5352621.1 His-Xaa-Ser system protein HxsD [Candidatus Omnitrophota bacterium]MDD5550220.1 His-Xaa-Ser system protein HxsD [Candidatus Omnitrophota bacterium]